MFAPDGYVPLSELWVQAQKRRVLAEILLEKKGFKQSDALVESADDLLWNWLMSFSRSELMLWDEEAAPFRVDFNLVNNRAFTLGLLQQRNLSTKELGALGMWELRKWATEPCDNALAGAAGFSSPPLFIAPASGQLRTDFLKWALSRRAEGADYLFPWIKGNTALGILAPFNGCSFCLPKSTTKEGWDPFWAKVASVVARFDNRGTKPKVGRPLLQDLARPAYFYLYPNGHKAAGVTFKIAAAEVGKVIGEEGLSEKTLRRALKNDA